MVLLICFEECTSISIDYGIMEKTDKAIVYPVSFGWSTGTWESLYAQVDKDESHNHIQTVDNMLVNVTNSLCF